MEESFIFGGYHYEIHITEDISLKFTKLTLVLSQNCQS